MSTINKILKDTVQHLSKNNSMNKFHCKCNGLYDFKKQKSNRQSDQTKSSSKRYNGNKNFEDHEESDYFEHKPSQEFLLNCLNMFQRLFDVDCYLNVPTKINDLYYKYGQLVNFKKAIQNIFDPSIWVFSCFLEIF